MAPASRRCGKMSALLVSLVALAPPVAVSAMTERNILLRFYDRAGGSRWRRNNGWRQAADGDESRPICTWDGVVCANGNSHDGHKIVTGLFLADNLLTGHVTPHLWNLPFLNKLDLGGNKLTEAGLEGLSSGSNKAPIESLTLSENQISSLAGIEEAHDTLLELHFGSNAFKGSFPAEVFKLKKLQVLRATFNSGITGPLPTAIGHLIHLRELDLSFNSISGSIPKEICDLNLLQYLVLEENKFVGPLPADMNQMVSLKYLSIGNTSPNAGRLTGPLPSFADLTHLRELFLPANALTGSIPSDFLKHSANTQKPVTIDLGSNLLSGKVPKSLGQFEKLNINLSSNRIAGIPNELCHKKKWMDGLVGKYGCDAILCPKGTYSESGRKESDGQTCQPCRGGEEYGPYLGATDCIADLDYEAKEDIEEFDPSDAEDVEGAVGTVASPPAQPAATAKSEEGGALSGVAKFFIVLIVLAVPVVLFFALYTGVKRSRVRKQVKKMENKTLGVGIPEDTSTQTSVDEWQGSFRAKKSPSSVSEGGRSSCSSEPERCIL